MNSQIEHLITSKWAAALAQRQDNQLAILTSRIQIQLQMEHRENWKKTLRHQGKLTAFTTT